MQTLSELIAKLKIKFPQEQVLLNLTNTKTGVTSSTLQPRFLFRGERNLDWKTTTSTFSRFNTSTDFFKELNFWITGIIPRLGIQYENQRYSLHQFLKEALSETEEPTRTNETDLELHIAAILQHYGFVTSFIDVSGDIEVAAAFASGGKVGDVGQIMVLESKMVEDLYFDLASVPAKRPKAQHAFVLWGTSELDLKSPNFLNQYGAQWYKFRLSKDDSNYFSDNHLLTTLDDPIAKNILEWYQSHIENNDSISQEASDYFAEVVASLK